MRMLSSVFCAAVLTAVNPAAAAKPEVIIPAEDVVWVDDLKVPKPLINRRGKSFRGMEVFIDRKRGNCVACHSNFDVQAMQFLGNVGPNLNGVGSRYSKPELRAILVDSHRMFGDETIMPGFYVKRWGARTPEKFQNTTILTAQEIEDLVSYLLELQQ
ncbi:MAG: sulfur-oxidizing protein SoxX [Paracoccaceae bacterium]|jgi:sulfur-oxidizing protein SoxX